MLTIFWPEIFLVSSTDIDCTTQQPSLAVFLFPPPSEGGRGLISFVHPQPVLRRAAQRRFEVVGFALCGDNTFCSSLLRRLISAWEEGGSFDVVQDSLVMSSCRPMPPGQGDDESVPCLAGWDITVVSLFSPSTLLHYFSSSHSPHSARPRRASPIYIARKFRSDTPLAATTTRRSPQICPRTGQE